MKALTEDEARQKICPYLSASCQASGCMMWRWVSIEFSRRTELWSKSRNQKVNSAFRDDAEWRPIEGEPTEPPPAVGHCSLIKNNQWSY